MKCFVVMPYGKREYEKKHYTAVYDGLIRPAVEAAGLECIRSDRDEKGGHILDNVAEYLADCDVVVADISCFNWNVAYELGIRHSVRKTGTVLVCDEEYRDELPFDIKMSKIHFYSPKWEDNKERACEELKQAIEYRLVESSGCDSPVYDKVHLGKIDKSDPAYKVFTYESQKGIMKNPEDGKRNVSFRTDTFINMFGGAFDAIVDSMGESFACESFRKTGYYSGSSFAERLNDTWEGKSISYQEKLKKWCEFDSDVGWGRFDIELLDDSQTGEFSGRLTIDECFIVDKKSKRHICEFVKGYCEGVIETLLGMEVELVCTSCPMKNRFKTACEFAIELKE